MTDKSDESNNLNNVKIGILANDNGKTMPTNEPANRWGAKLTSRAPVEVIQRRRKYEALLGVPPGTLDNSPTLRIVDKLMQIMAEEASKPDYLAINAEFSQ